MKFTISANAATPRSAANINRNSISTADFPCFITTYLRSLGTRNIKMARIRKKPAIIYKLKFGEIKFIPINVRISLTKVTAIITLLAGSLVISYSVKIA